MGLCPDDLGAARLGCGAWTGEVVRMMGPWPLFAGDAFDGEWWGYCEGAAGLGRSPELLVKGWVARGSKDLSTEFDMMCGESWVRVRWLNARMRRGESEGEIYEWGCPMG